MGVAYYRTQQYELALQAWLRANSIDPKTPDPYFNLIRYYTFIAKDKEEAVRYVNEAKKRGFQLPTDLQAIYKYY